MKLIEISKNSKKIKGVYSAQVDDEDYEFLNQYRWAMSPTTTMKYANTNIDGKCVTMHRLILQVEGRKNLVDHIDRNGLNNQRSNLRIATHSQNGANRGVSKTKRTSTYLSVYMRKGDNRIFKWYSSIMFKGEKIFLGYFDCEIKAAKAYDKKALELFGEYANINIK